MIRFRIRPCGSFLFQKSIAVFMQGESKKRLQQNVFFLFVNYQSISTPHVFLHIDEFL